MKQKECFLFANQKICSCYHTVPGAICGIFSEFLIFCNLFYEPLGEWNTSKIWEKRKIIAYICIYCTRQRAITTLSLNACLNKIHQELFSLLIVSGLLNTIKCNIRTNKQNQKLQVLALPGYVLHFLTGLYFHV